MAHGAPQSMPDEKQAYEFVVDGKTYPSEKPVLKASEIMAAAGIDRSQGLVEVGEDGTERSLKPEDDCHLDEGKRFKKPPRFKRG